MEFGERLKMIRRDLELSQRQLAKLSGVPQTSISTWELNKSVPSLDALYSLADALQCTVDYLIGREAEDGIINIKYTGYIPTDEEVEFLKRYKKLTPTQKQTVQSVISTFLQK